jgi:hypothetical protein
MYNSTIYDYYDDGGILGNRTLLFQTKEMVVKRISCPKAAYSFI